MYASNNWTWDEYESDYYDTYPCESVKIPNSDIQDIWDEHDIVDNPGTNDNPIGIAYLGDFA